MNPMTEPTASANGEWECMECGYVVEGARAHRPAQCPDCGAPGQALEFFSDSDDDGDAWDDRAADLTDEDEDDELLVDDDDERLL